MMMVVICYLLIIAYALLERSASRIMIIMKKVLFLSNLKLFIYIYLFIMSVIYISIDFSLGKSWRFEKAKLIKHKLWSAGLPLDAWSLL